MMQKAFDKLPSINPLFSFPFPVRGTLQLPGGASFPVSYTHLDCGCDGVDLRCISGSEHSQYTESSEKIGQKMPFFAETVFDVIHRSADEFPVGVFLVIENSQCYLGKFRTHAEQGGNPHPEHGTGSADSDSAGNTGNITGTDRGGKCCTCLLYTSRCV